MMRSKSRNTLGLGFLIKSIFIANVVQLTLTHNESGIIMSRQSRQDQGGE